MPTTTCNIMYRVSDSLMIWEAKSWEVRLSESGRHLLITLLSGLKPSSHQRHFIDA